MINRRRLLAGLAATPLVAACGSTSSKAKAGGAAVTFLTAYGTTPRETYPWVGVAKGFFKDAGIDLTVRPGQPSDANLKSLAAGKAQFASLDYVSAVRGAAKFPDFRTICALQNATLLSMLTYTDRGITKPADLAGKRLGVAPAAASQTLFPAYAKAAGFDASACKYVTAASDQLPSLLATGRVDAIGAYASDTANAENAAPGKTAIAFPYGKYIGDLYGTVVIATTGVLSSNLDLARRFAAAMVKTVEFAVDNPEESGRLAHAALPTVKSAVVTAVDRNLKPYTGPFSLDRAKVARSIGVLQRAGLAKAGLTPDDVVNFDIAAKAGAP